MNKELESFFRSHSVEYFSVLKYSDCKELFPHIRQRLDFEPKSVIVWLIPYYVSKPSNLSAYASSLDYHLYIKELSRELSAFLTEHYTGCRVHGFGDNSPIDERHAALIGGLGILGDSGMLINEKYGTYVFIADTVTDIDASQFDTVKKEIEYCIHCGSCAAACPTGIIGGCSTECLSAITQKKGKLNEDEISLMKKYNTVWGCDICQECCPYNKDKPVTPIEFFHTERIESLDSELLSSLSRDELRKRAFGWRGRSVLIRNLDIF